MTDRAPLARRLSAASVSTGGSRSLHVAARPAEPDDRAIDYQLGFDLGYRDGLDKAIKDAEATAEAACQRWQAEAQETLDGERAALASARDAFDAASVAWQARVAEDDAWASGVVVEAVYEVVAAYLGHRHADRQLMGELCAQVLRTMPERPLVLRVAKEDADDIRAQAGERIDIQVDESLTRSECVVESPRGRLVTGIAARMDILRAELLRVLVQPSVEGGDA